VQLYNSRPFIPQQQRLKNNALFITIFIQNNALFCIFSMKSLHQFMFDKKLDRALRFDRNPPSQLDLSVKTTQGDTVRYRLYSLPLYMAGFADRIL